MDQFCADSYYSDEGLIVFVLDWQSGLSLQLHIVIMLLKNQDCSLLKLSR